MAKWNRGKKQRERRKFSENQEPPRPQVIRIQQTFATPEEMVALGPFVQAEWAVPPEQAKAMREAGEAVPAPLRGAFLLDTGADNSFINTAVIRELRLQPMTNVVSPDPNDVPPAVFRVELAFYVRQVTQDERVAVVRHVLPAPALEHSAPPGEPGLLGVLGRDFLRHTHLSYDGPRGQFVLEILKKELEKGF